MPSADVLVVRRAGPAGIEGAGSGGRSQAQCAAVDRCGRTTGSSGGRLRVKKHEKIDPRRGAGGDWVARLSRIYIPKPPRPNVSVHERNRPWFGGPMTAVHFGASSSGVADHGRETWPRGHIFGANGFGKSRQAQPNLAENGGGEIETAALLFRRQTILPGKSSYGMVVGGPFLRENAFVAADGGARKIVIYLYNDGLLGMGRRQGSFDLDGMAGRPYRRPSVEQPAISVFEEGRRALSPASAGHLPVFKEWPRFVCRWPPEVEGFRKLTGQQSDKRRGKKKRK